MSNLAKVLLVFVLICVVNVSKVEALQVSDIEKQDVVEQIKDIEVKKSDLKKEIDYIEQSIIDKESMLENSNSDVVTLSFIEDSDSIGFDVEDELNSLQAIKISLDGEVEKLSLQQAKLEKSLEVYVSAGCWPVPGFNDISSPYGYRIHPISKEKKLHKGIDIPAPSGSDIVATDDGVVKFSGVQNGYGNVIEIQHFDGKISKYAHNDENLVYEGNVVSKGEVIGKIGSTGKSTGPHVHFEVLLNGDVKNPLEMISN